MIDYLHPFRDDIKAIRKDLTKLELEFDYSCNQEPAMTEAELSALITRLACRQEQLERITANELHNRSQSSSDF